MKKDSKTIRINKLVLDRLVEMAEAENRSVSNVIETICFQLISRKEFAVDGIKYMPIHMLNEDLYDILSFSQSILSKKGEICIVKVRKHHGSKGVAFCVDHFYLDDKEVKSLSRRYSFSIDPNWEILDFFDHWTHSYVEVNDKSNKSYASEKINVNEKAQVVIKEIQKNMVKRGKPEVNPIFNTQDWVEIYYKHEKYPLEI